jgi:hydroxymethylpyrimidine pyrophosphatase-like HAD family hydrolase
MEKLKRLIAADIDGTLLAWGRLPRKNGEALRAARQAGCAVAVCTGRWDGFIPAMFHDPALVTYRVSLDGSVVIKNTEAGEERLLSSQINAETAIPILEETARRGAGIKASFDDGEITSRKIVLQMLSRVPRYWVHDRSVISCGITPCRHLPAPLRWLLPKLPTDKGRLTNNITQIVAKELDSGRILHKLECHFFQGEDIREEIAHIKAKNSLHIDFSGKTSLDITADGVSKGAGITVIAEKDGFDRQNILALGDSGIDLPLSEAAGTFVAMGGSLPPVVQAAAWTTGRAEDGGAGDAIMKWLKMS